jgi:ketosteroid isomerase-like protein
MSRTPAVLAIGLVAAGACFLPGRAREAPLSRSPARDSLLAFDLTRNDSLAGRGLAGSMRSYLDPDVIYLRAGAHVAYGSDRALKLLELVRPLTAPFVAWQPVGGGVSRDQSSGFTFGIAVRAQPEQGVLIERYLAFWSRERSGPWRITGYVEVSPGVLSTAAGDKQSPVRAAPAVHALLAADSAFAERASVSGAAAAARKSFADDGILLGAVQLVVGPRAAADYFDSRRSSSVSWMPRDGEVAASSDLGFTVGDAVATSRGPSGAAAQRFTKYLTVWRKIGGQWRIVATGANERPSPIGD